MKNYICDKVKEIIEDKFIINIDFNIEKYKVFLTEDRLKEIEIYSRYGLVSPQIYNICYLYLTKEKGFSKQGVKDCFIKIVNRSKEQMKIIDEKNFTPKDYFSYCGIEIKSQIEANIVEQNNEKISYTCENCMVMRKGDCIGEKNICEYFRFVRTVSKEEIESWPNEMGYRDSYFYRNK